MVQFYTPLFILQAVCLYHAYRNNAEQRWYWLIIFIPGIGCAIYLFQNLYNRRNIQSLTEGVKEVVNSNYRIEQLEKSLKFTNTFSNRMRLADAYVTYGRYNDAIVLYRECLVGYMAEDPVLRMKLLEACFLNRDYESAAGYGEQLKAEKVFKNAVERVAYAWALHYTGKTDLAGEVFKDMDKSFSNYKQRVEYCKFLMSTNQPEGLKERLSELREELEHMKGPERKLHRDVIREIKDLYADTFKS